MNKISFTCTCSLEFEYSLESNKIIKETYHCMDYDENCACDGISYEAHCPECGNICEGEYLL